LNFAVRHHSTERFGGLTAFSRSPGPGHDDVRADYKSIVPEIPLQLKRVIPSPRRPN
jgi:hypothetical protein